MVGTLECGEGVFLRVTGELMELQGHLEGCFDGGGTVIGEEAASEVRGPELAEFLCELSGGRVGESEKGGMGDALELPMDCGIEARVVMSVDVGPDGGVTVEVGVTVLVGDAAALARDDGEGLRFEPVPHVGERMPDELAVPVGWSFLHQA